jgi:hypothetical protein
MFEGLKVEADNLETDLFYRHVQWCSQRFRVLPAALSAYAEVRRPSCGYSPADSETFPPDSRRVGNGWWMVDG